jgi:uncharacterized protein (TIGR03086 family)
MTTADAFPVLAAAHAALRSAVAGLAGADLGRPSPCSEWTVAQALQHAVLDQGIWAASAAGAPPPKGDAFAPSGDVPADVVGYVRTALRDAAQAWTTLDPGQAAEVGSPLPQGALPIATAEQAAALDAAVHAWDIAAAIGADRVLDADLAEAITPAAHCLVEPLRQWGAYAASLPPAPTDDVVAALLRYLGRDPNWSAPV